MYPIQRWRAVRRRPKAEARLVGLALAPDPRLQPGVWGRRMRDIKGPHSLIILLCPETPQPSACRARSPLHWSASFVHSRASPSACSTPSGRRVALDDAAGGADSHLETTEWKREAAGCRPRVWWQAVIRYRSGRRTDPGRCRRLAWRRPLPSRRRCVANRAPGAGSRCQGFPACRYRPRRCDGTAVDG